MKKSRKVVLKNENGEILRVFRNTYEAGRATGTSHETIRRAIIGQKTKLQEKGMYFEWGKDNQERYGYRKRTVVVKDNGEVKVYNTQTELAKDLGVSLASVNHYIHKRINSPKGTKIYDYNEYVKLFGEPEEQQAEKEYSEEIKEEVKEEITHKTETMYYVNVLVGLANGTLEDGATYEMRNNVLKYNKEKEALMLGEAVYLSKNSMFDEVRVELPLLIEKEKTFLSNLLKAFSGAKGIQKCSDYRKGFEFIRIVSGGETTDLPSFIEGKYYGNLKQNRLYSLDELGL